jgi:hypothetical protein
MAAFCCGWSRAAIPEMLERLGNVLFWIGVIIAVGWLVLSYFAGKSIPAPHVFDYADFLTSAVVPVLSVGIGLALRYILAGPK